LWWEAVRFSENARDRRRGRISRGAEAVEQIFGLEAHVLAKHPFKTAAAIAADHKFVDDANRTYGLGRDESHWPIADRLRCLDSLRHRLSRRLRRRGCRDEERDTNGHANGPSQSTAMELLMRVVRLKVGECIVIVVASGAGAVNVGFDADEAAVELKIVADLCATGEAVWYRT
jgi:hypothetical protein